MPLRKPWLAHARRPAVTFICLPARSPVMIPRWKTAALLVMLAAALVIALSLTGLLFGFDRHFQGILLGPHSVCRGPAIVALAVLTILAWAAVLSLVVAVIRRRKKGG